METFFCYDSLTPLGKIAIGMEGGAVTRLIFGEKLPEGAVVLELPTVLSACCKQELEEYFAGTRQTFDLPLAPKGTAFQQKVWAALREIPYGQTRSYGEIAAAVGNPKASRAVGMANHQNPISILIPCHRVIGKDGSLTGYGGGLDKKKWLLELEQAGKRLE